MLGIDNYLLFVAAGVALNVTPGPDMLYVGTRAAAQGRRAGLVSALAVTCGGLVHTAAAALGLSAVLLYSAWAFEAVRWLGAAYLVWLGCRTLWQTWREQHHGHAAAPCAATAHRHSPRTIFRQGMVVSVCNPKVALFFLAFLPQFVRADAPAAPLGMALLGLTFCATGLATLCAIAMACGMVNHRLAARAPRRLGGWVAGSVFLAMGVGLGLARRAH